MTTMPSARLDMPLQLTAQGDVSRLTLTFDGSEDARRATSGLAGSGLREGAVVVIVAVNPVDDSKTALAQLGSGHEESIVGNGAGIATISRVCQILELWRAEQHVLFVAPRSQVEHRLTRAERNRQKWWQFSSTARDELAFLTLIDEPLLIFSDSRASVEIYSKDDHVLLAIAAQARGGALCAPSRDPTGRL